MYEFVYIEINLLCVFILCYILYRQHKDINKRAENLAFSHTAQALVAILVVDALWALLDGMPGSFFFWFNSLVNVLYMSLTVLIPYLWLLFSQHELDVTPSRLVSFLTAAPLALFFLACLTSPWTHLIFYVDAENMYHRGLCHYVQQLMGYGYLLASAALVLVRLRRTSNRQGRMRLCTLLLLPALPVVGSILGLIMYGLPAFWPLATVSLLMVYVNFLGYEISTDGLTMLNNRRQFDRYLSAAVADETRTRHLYLLLLDIDNFKEINDRYGHREGDGALVLFAEALRGVCGKRDLFLARYGGDEFAIVYRCAGDADVELLIKDIDGQLAKRNAMPDARFEVTASIGYAEYVPDGTVSVDELIREADKDLYLHKAERKAERKAELRLSEKARVA